MKKLFFTAVLFTGITGCSFVKDVQSHCKPEITTGSIQTGSFTACLRCDSLAKVVYTHINKQIEKK